MSYIEKEKLIKADIASIENRVRHAFNQGYDLGFKDGKGKAKPQEQEPTTKNDLALLEKTYADFCNCEGGEGWLKIDGKEYATDAGYALEGMSIFMEVFKRRLAELPSVTPQLSSALEKNSKKLEKPITKNDLGVRKFEEIVVEYPPEDLCTYPEYKGKPYFGIKYKEGNDYIIGYGTYNPKVLSRYLTDYFMPSVKPQEPKKGYWIDDTRLGYHVSICSNCNWRGHGDTCLIYKPKYCPNCGCRMIEPHESEVNNE